MVFNSIEFIIFLPIVYLLYWLMPKNYRHIELLFASYVFYMWWNWKLIVLILFTTIVSYASGIIISRNQSIKIRKTVLCVGIVLCLGVLFFFKYFNFLFEIVSSVGNKIKVGSLSGYFEIILPVGISFYTFQTLSYIVDVYKGTIAAEKDISYYALFVTFFPQLVAGPIERPGDLLPQLKNRDAKFKQIEYNDAFRYLLIGAFKKVAIADIIGIYVNKVYENLVDSNGLMILFATLLFSIQIYCDFSGYSDIAVGCAKLFGINLTENFNSPYKSKSIKEFWTRWHISLSRWLRDYVYFPLGGSRVKKIRWAINIIIVFFISGLWHGASYNFIIWGLLHGICQIIGIVTLKWRDAFWEKSRIDPNGKIVSYLRIIGTFLLVTLIWVFFRANTVEDAGLAIYKIFTDYEFSSAYYESFVTKLGLNIYHIIYMVAGISLLVLCNKLKLITNETNILKESVVCKKYVRYMLYVIVAWITMGAWIYLQAINVGSSFIYFQF